MLLRASRSVVILALVFAVPAVAQTQLDSSPAGRRLKSFIDAYNAGTLDRLRDYVVRESDPRIFEGHPAKIDNLAAYLFNVYRQFGPVVYHSVARAAENELEIWTWATATQSWVGFDFVVDSAPPYLVREYALVRGNRPRDLRDSTALDPANLASRLRHDLAQSAEGGFFSGVVLVAHGGGRPVFEGAYGWADETQARRNTLATPFHVASLSKMFTAAAVLRLAAQSRLALRDPIGRYLPGLPRRVAERVTIRHLLTHTSGIELDEMEDYNRAVARAATMSEVYQAQLQFLPRLVTDSFSPPDRYDYSNEDYDLLGMIVQRVSGISYDDYLKRYVFDAAGMNHTDAYSPGHSILGGAVGYTSRDTSGAYRPALGPNTAFLDARTRPSGGHYATARDLLNFARWVDAEAAADTSLFRLMRSPQVTIHEAPGESSSYGYGFHIERRGGVTLMGHGGGFYGASARLDIYPERGYVVVVLSNRDWVANNVADHIRALIGGYGR